VMLDSAQSLGTEGQVLQVTETDGTLHVSWVDISEYSAGTGIALSESEFSIGQAVGTTDDVTFDDVAADSLSASGELSVTGKTILNDSLIVSGSSTISGSLLVDSISVTDVINGQVGSIGNHNLDALNDVPGMGSPGAYLRVKSDSTGLEYATIEAATYTAGTGMDLSGSEFSIGQAVGTTDDVTFDDVAADSLSASGELSVTGKAILNDSLIVSGSSTISGSLLVDSISVTDVINGQVGSIGNHNLDALNDVPGMGSPGAYLRVKSDSTGLEYATIEAANYTAGTGMNLSGSEFSIGQAVGTTDDVTFDDITADTLDATITFLDTAMIGHLNVGPEESMQRFTVSYLEDEGPFSSYMENFVSTTSDIHQLSSNLSAFQAETVSLNYANDMSESGIQGQVGTIKGKNFTGNGLRESYLGVSKDSLINEGIGDADFDEWLTYESLIVASFFQELSMDEEFTNDPTAQLQMLSSFYGQLPIEAGFLNESSDEGPYSSETVELESTVATKSSAFASYQSSGYRNVRQVYQANADSSSHAYGTGTDDDFYIDSIDFSTTEAQTILQTYNDEYVDFEFLEMTEQDSGLTVMHDDYGIALSTGTRYQQATDSTVTRIPAVAGLEMHAESGKTVLYADTIELRGVVQMYQDVELNGNLTAPNIVEQNMGTYIANEASYGTGNADRDGFTYSNSPGELSIVPLLTDNDNTKQPVSEDYSFDASQEGVYISGDSARGTYLVSATMTVQNLSEDDVDSGYLPPSGLISQHLFDLRPGLLSTEIFPGCQTSFYYLGDSTEVTVNLSCYVHHEDAGDLNVYLHHTNNSPSDAIAIKGGSLGIRKLNHYK
ncbi:hypothetical protein N8891_06330, partial [Flavobacteriales bacterium]|nr:hypothetical protein [Flavobacteriales bacterium]